MSPIKFDDDGFATDYDPNTPEEMARADALDALDLEIGADFNGPSRSARRTRVRPGAGKVDVLELRARLGLSLFHPDDPPQHDPTAAEESSVRLERKQARRGRKRRPSELERDEEFRAADAARKRADRRAKRKGGRDAA